MRHNWAYHAVLLAFLLSGGTAFAQGTPSAVIGGPPAAGTITGVVQPANGGTGVNNGTNTLTWGGTTVFSGAFAVTITSTATTNATLPAGTHSLAPLDSPALTTPSVTGGTLAGLTGLAIRDTSAAFDVTFAGTSNPALTAGHALTYNLANGDRTFKLASNLTVVTDPGGITGALKSNGSGTFTQAACADLSNSAASCSTDTTSATNISSGTLSAARLNLGTGLAASGTQVQVNGNNVFGAPNFKVVLSASQSVSSGVNTKVLLDTVTFDSGSYYSSGIYTPLIAGTYLFCANVSIGGATVTAGSTSIIYISKNGTIGGTGVSQVNASSVSGAVNDYPSQSPCTLVAMNGSTDKVEVDVNVVATSSPQVAGGAGASTTFSGYRIGP